MLKYKIGDLIEAAKSGEVKVIAHGCNCFNTMGSGIAPQIKLAFPEAFSADQNTIKGSKSKLGSYSKGINHSYNSSIVVYNLYTQFGYWGRNNGIRDLDYNALYNSLSLMSKDILASHATLPIGLPMIGAGLALGNWNIIEIMIKETLIYDGHDVTIYKLK